MLNVLIYLTFSLIVCLHLFLASLFVLWDYFIGLAFLTPQSKVFHFMFDYKRKTDFHLIFVRLWELEFHYWYFLELIFSFLNLWIFNFFPPKALGFPLKYHPVHFQAKSLVFEAAQLCFNLFLFKLSMMKCFRLNFSLNII